MKSWLSIIVALLALAVASLANAAVSASLDSDEVTPGDSVQLTLVHDGRTRDEPDLSPLDKDFDVLGRQSSTSLQIVNGSTSASTQLTLTLSPKHSGTMTVPSLSWSGEKTRPLTLNVASGAGGQGSDQGTGQGQAQSANVFLETEVDSKRPLVQAAVSITVKLYVAETLYRANLDMPESGDVVVRKVGDDKQDEAVRNGRTYQVVTRHYLVFPQHSGAIKLAGAVLSAQVADRRRSNPFGDDPFAGVFGGATSTRPLRLHGDDITLDVQPRPAGFENGYWLPARQVTLEGEWSPANAQTHVGDPITLTLRLQAEGQAAAQLPDLSTLLELPDGVKAYPDQAKLDDSTKGDAVVGTRSQSIALIADEAGRFSLPDLKVRWWDTRTGQPRETTLAGKTLVILAATGAPSTSTAVNPATSAGAAAGSSVSPGATSGSASGANAGGASQGAGASRGRGAPSASAGGRPNGLATQARGEEVPWRWIALGLAVLWLATLAAWFGSKRFGWKKRPVSSPPPVGADTFAGGADARQARVAFEAACGKNDALAARRALLAWARATVPHAPPAGLNALAKQVDDPAIAALIRGLDRACYAGETWQDGTALAQALRDLPTPKGIIAPSRGHSPLAPLYP